MKRQKLFNKKIVVTKHAMKRYLLRLKGYEEEQYEYLMQGVKEANKGSLARYKHFEDEINRKIKHSVMSHLTKDGEIRREVKGSICERCVFPLTVTNGRYYLRTIRLQGSKHDFFKVGV